MSAGSRLIDKLVGQFRLGNERSTVMHYRENAFTGDTGPFPLFQLPSRAMRAAIFVVDDQREVANATATLLRSWGHQVVVETSGPRALAILKGPAVFDVSFLDLLMPEMTGGQIYNELKKHAPARLKRLVFLTGMAYMVETWLKQTGLPVIEKGGHETEVKLARTVKEFASLECSRGPVETNPKFIQTAEMPSHHDLRELLSRDAEEEEDDDDDSADDTGVFINRIEEIRTKRVENGDSEITFATVEYLHKKHGRLTKRVGKVEKSLDKQKYWLAGFLFALSGVLTVYELWRSGHH